MTADHGASCARDRLWSAIRGGRLGGMAFRRKRSSFWCPVHRLVVEIAESDAPTAEDFARLAQWERHGCRVLQFRSDEVRENLPRVLVVIRAGAEP